ncbi:MAG: HAMP domain-containing histidine kinase [Proteobacteria bacterium]|nr:HAMP domain-containing histidine kinase [Pseudomonadota bacterium]
MSYAAIDALWQWMSGDTDAQAPLLQVARRRFLTFTAVLTIASGVVWIALTSGTAAASRPFVALAPLAFVPFPYLALRTSIKLDVIAHAFLITFFVVITLIAGSLGGDVSTTSFFLMLLPLLATLLFGIRTGLIWMVIVALTYAGLHMVRDLLPPSTDHTRTIAGEEWVGVGEVGFWNGCVMSFLAVAVGLAVANFRAVVAQSSSLLVTAANRTRDALEARAVAEEVSLSKSEFIANVSEELRSPLNTIIGYSELLIESAQDRGDDGAATDNKHVLEAAQRLQTLIDNILRLAAIDADRLRVIVDECDLKGLVRDAVIAFAPMAEANGTRILVDDQVEPGLWLTDGHKLDMCVRNLLSNATRFTSKGAITISVSRRDVDRRCWLRLQVKDTGAGLEAGRLERVFDAFHGSGDDEGLGLGLTVTHRLARLLGGELSAASEAEGGACFTLDIPADFRPDSPASSRQTA